MKKHHKSIIIMAILFVIIIPLIMAAPTSLKAGANEPSSWIVTFPPSQAGTFSVMVFKYVSSAHDHGIQCPVNVAIPAGITAAQKAQIIAAAIAAACNVTATPAGNTVHVQNNGPQKYGVSAKIVSDGTGEYDLVENRCNDDTGEKRYQTIVSLHGTPTTGTAMFGENGVSHTVTTDGKTIQEIYEEWQTLFGEGTVYAAGFALPVRYQSTCEDRGFEWEVTDTNLVIKIVQNEHYPLDVNLTSFDAVRRDDHIEVIWNTASGFENAGFNLHRSINKASGMVLLNSELIPASDDELLGGSYSFVDYDISVGGDYYYWLEDVDVHGNSTFHGPVVAAAKKDTPGPVAFSLAQNHPNPFNPNTRIMYNLAADCHVTLDIYNALGQKVATLVNEHQKAGSKTVEWNGRDASGVNVASGIYFYKITAGSFVDIKKMVLLR